MKGFPSDTTPASSSLVKWGHWMQTFLLMGLLLLLFHRLNLLPPLDVTPTAADVQRQYNEQHLSQARSQ